MMRLSLLIVSLIAAFLTDPVLGKPIPVPPASVTGWRRDTNNSSAYVLAQQLLSTSSDNCTGIGGGCAVLGEALPSCSSSDECACDLSLAAQVCAQCDATTDAYSKYNTYLQACVTEGLANPSGTVSAAINAASGSSTTLPEQSTSAVQSASTSTSQSQTASGVLGIQAGILSDTLSASSTSSSTSVAAASTSRGVVLLENGGNDNSASVSDIPVTSASLASASASSDASNTSSTLTSSSSASQTASDIINPATASSSANSSSATSSSSDVSSSSASASAAVSSASSNATSSVSVTAVPSGSVGAEAAVATATTTVNGDFGVRRATIDLSTALLLVLSTSVGVTLVL